MTNTAPGARPRLVIFYSERSGACRKVDRFLAQVLQRNGNHRTFEIVRVDVDKRADLVERLRITTIPELLIVEGNKVQARLRKPRGTPDLYRRPGAVAETRRVRNEPPSHATSSDDGHRLVKPLTSHADRFGRHP